MYSSKFQSSYHGVIADINPDEIVLTSFWRIIHLLSTVEPTKRLRVVSLISPDTVAKIGFMNHIFSNAGAPLGPCRKSEAVGERIKFFLDSNSTKDGYTLFLDFPIHVLFQKDAFEFLYRVTNHFVLLSTKVDLKAGVFCEEFVKEYMNAFLVSDRNSEGVNLPNPKFHFLVDNRKDEDSKAKLSRVIPDQLARKKFRRVFRGQVTIEGYNREAIQQNRQRLLLDEFGWDYSQSIQLVILVKLLEALLGRMKKRLSEKDIENRFLQETLGEESSDGEFVMMKNNRLSHEDHST